MGSFALGSGDAVSLYIAEKAARSSILGAVRHTYNIILTQEMKLAVSGKYQHHFYILLYVYVSWLVLPNCEQNLT